MGKYLNLDTGLFGQVNLGSVTPKEIVPIQGISITGNDVAYRGKVTTYSVSYIPSNTSDIGVAWSVLDSPDGATFDQYGNLTLTADFVGDTITIMATSMVNTEITATRILSVETLSAIEYSMANLYTGNINSSKKTSAGSYFVHYENAIALNGKTKVKITFPNVGSSYFSYKWNVKVVELNTIDGLPSNWLTSASVALTNYISAFPDYSKVNITGNDDFFEYTITGANTIAVCIQWSMYSGTADIQCFSTTTYGKQVTTQTRKSWINTLSTDDVLGTIQLL